MKATEMTFEMDSNLPEDFMKVCNRSHAELKIDRSGKISVESVWEVMPAGAATGVDELLEAARAWAGKIGEPFRLPDATGEAFQYSETLQVSALAFKPVNNQLCRVTFTGVGQEEELLPLGETTDRHLEDGTHLRIRRWSLTEAAAAKELLPHPGALLDWEGGAFVCLSAEEKREEGELPSYTVTARETTCHPMTPVLREESIEGERTARIVWFVSLEEFNAFATQHPLRGKAAWAGDDYHLTSRESKEVGLLGFRVTLTAREVSTRLLEAVRGEGFHSFSRSGMVRREITWKARYQARTADLERFNLLTGFAPEDFGEADCLVTRVTPKRLSEHEYEITVEAEKKSNPGLFDHYNASDRSNLAGREDVSVDLTEFRVSAEMAGYAPDGAGSYQAIADWRPAESCPFTAAKALDKNMVETILRTLVITVVEYSPGDAKSKISSLASWATGRIHTGSVAGRSGSYLKVRQTCSETCDDSGNRYTRISRSYQLAPGSYTWNASYWSNH